MLLEEQEYHLRLTTSWKFQRPLINRLKTISLMLINHKIAFFCPHASWNQSLSILCCDRPVHDHKIGGKSKDSTKNQKDFNYFHLILLRCFENLLVNPDQLESTLINFQEALSPFPSYSLGKKGQCQHTGYSCKTGSANWVTTKCCRWSNRRWWYAIIEF